MNLTSSSSESDSEETSGSTTVAEELLQVQDSRDSIDRELDAMEQPPSEASVPVVAAAPSAQHRKKATTSAYIQDAICHWCGEYLVDGGIVGSDKAVV
ncbi:hypothetical protein M405DRAFT_939145 [Rhizopogon salebrosus TDB-379]|nr:hypothetical protein M405DRAFT_939145 [Rhizopogon salebrosus TDB-379]